MKFAVKSALAYLFFFSVTPDNSFSQPLSQHINEDNFTLNVSSMKPAASNALPLAIGVISALYLFNPIIQYEDKKVSAGITKEFSIGFGYFGEHRVAFEYSYIFRSGIRNSIKFSYKYDILLKDLEPSHMLQTTGVISIGAGYFTNFKDKGVFPEMSYGYSIRNHRLLIYPHVKFRFIFINDKEKTNIADLSFGIMVGIANPFIEMKFRRK